MDFEETTPHRVHQLFRHLLHTYNSPSPVSTTPVPPPSSSSLEKYAIRFIENNENSHREKYDGRRWRLVCTWNDNECTNFAICSKLCKKHNAQRRKKILASQTNEHLAPCSSLPNIYQSTVNNDNGNDIEFIGEFNENKFIYTHTNPIIKSEFSDFKQFSIDSDDDNVPYHETKLEAQSSSSYYFQSPIDVEYVGSKISTTGLNITELISKNIPPLTDFEEDFIGTLLMKQMPTTCSMLDAQLYLHQEAIMVVNKNYRYKMNTVSPEYFYDFLLRHPHIAIHYKNWFLRCKPIPPTTGCAIDTKIWTLSMMVRGTLNSDEANDT